MLEDIIIKIKRQPPQPSGKKNVRRSRGVRPASAEDDYLPRRLKKEVLLNFYDLGEIKNESNVFIDLPFETVPGYFFDENDQIHYDNFTASDWNVMRDLLLSNAASTWANLHRKLTFESAERYGLDLMAKGKQLSAARNDSRKKVYSNELVSDTKWTEAGLKVPSGADLQTLCNSAFYNFNTADTENIKVTALPDYLEPAVPFSITAATDVYLVPLVAAIIGAVTNVNNVPLQRLMAQIAIIRRSLVLDDADFQTDTEYLSFFTMPGISLGGALSAGFADKLLEFYKSQPNTVAYDQLTGLFIPLAAFPSEPDFTISFDNILAFEFISNPSPQAGTLLAVLHQGDDWFYVWAKGRLDSTPILFGILHP